MKSTTNYDPASVLKKAEFFTNVQLGSSIGARYGRTLPSRWKALKAIWAKLSCFKSKNIPQYAVYCTLFNRSPSSDLPATERQLIELVALAITEDSSVRKCMGVSKAMIFAEFRQIYNDDLFYTEASTKLFRDFVKSLSELLANEWNKAFIEAIRTSPLRTAIEPFVSSTNTPYEGIKQYQDAVIKLIPDADDWMLLDWIKWSSLERNLRKSYHVSSSGHSFESGHLLQFCIGGPEWMRDHGLYLKAVPENLASALWPDSMDAGVATAFRNTCIELRDHKAPWIPTGYMRFEETGIFKLLDEFMKVSPNAYKECRKACFDYQMGNI